MDRDRAAGVVDEELLPRLVVPAKGDVETLRPCLIPEAKLAVLVALGIDLLVFLPEALEGHVLSLELLVEVVEGRHVPLRCVQGDGRGEEEVLQGGLVPERSCCAQEPGGPGELHPTAPQGVGPLSPAREWTCPVANDAAACPPKAA